MVTTLRSAPVLGVGAERLPGRLLLGRPPLRVRGAAPPVQAVHVDDLVATLALVVLADHPGTFNVASDGWLDHETARALLDAPPVPALSPAVVDRLLRFTWQLGIGDVPPGVLPYLLHPWVIANDRLRSLGWVPRHGTEDAIVDGLHSLGRSQSTRSLVALGAGGLAGAGVTAWLLRRRWRRGASRPSPATPT